MRSHVIAAAFACVVLPALAQDDLKAATPSEASPLIVEADNLDEFLWTARPVVVFADTPNDPYFIEQMELLQARPGELLKRDVVVIADTDPSAASSIRRRLRPRGFALVLVGKDGQIKLRKPSPWDVRELTRSIDKTPLRQQEIRERRSGAGSG